jgi:hypothetical protein
MFFRVDIWSLSGVKVIHSSFSFNSNLTLFFSYEFLYIRGNELTPFSCPGDSGSAVVDNENRFIGIVTAILIDEEKKGKGYITEVLPIWIFHRWFFESLKPLYAFGGF